jgi:hypothetical protein
MWLNPNRLLSLFCFLLGIAFVTTGAWLCLRGEIPAIPIQDDTIVIPIDGISIGDVPVGRWAYPVVVTGFFGVAALLFIVGWCAGRRKRRHALP